MFWFDKDRSDVIFMDNRRVDKTLCDGRTFIVDPDIVADFRDIPYPDGTFSLVVFDPPHLLNGGESSWLVTKYGKLDKGWKEYILDGFSECMRVLKEDGVLIFKWSETDIKVSEIRNILPIQPLIGDRRSKTIWMVFMKGVEELSEAVA
ncbi:MAG: SAM-dependent methyltransferase [Candidatus Methanomethylophilaceae archaeon]